MIIESIIDAGLQQSYRKTRYKVFGDKPLTLKVGEACPALAALHKRHCVDCSAFITACNPFGEDAGDIVNAERHADLGRELGHRSLASIEGLGEHPTNGWSGEASYVVFGLTLEAAKTLGSRLEQNAIVWTGADCVPELVLLR
ncbi:MAG: DUF3293 domain-containing protein [Burkholderiaceae bacterium]|nr:DUF3293 domain-containing protein [Burkholderiaceae bacterium]